MALVVISTLTTTDTVLAAGDEYYLLEGVTQYDFGTVLSSPGNDIDISVFGTLFSSGTNALNFTGDDVTFFVGSTGRILSNEAFITINSDGEDVSVFNQGTISGGQIEAHGDGFHLDNSGTMQGLFDGATPLAWIEIYGANATILNTGLISSNNARVIELGSSGATGFTMVNSGTVTGSVNALFVTTSNPAVGITLSNAGTISAPDLAIFGGNGVDDILNTGLLMGDVDLRDGADILVNSGQIAGDVSLGDDGDRYVGAGSGLVTGQVDGGSGDDSLTGGDQGDNLLGGADGDTLLGRGGNDTLFGDDGDDRVIGGDGQDLVRGGNDNDVVRGGLGDDTVYGDNGVDQVFGGSGSDEMFGGADGDRMFGEDGNDSMSGEGGGDRMLGGNGNDTLIGGAGRDDINGGLGADTFKFTAVSDSAFGTPDQDRIYDYNSGESDKIDLSEIVGPELVFFGLGAFGAGAGVRLIEAGGNTLVDVDTNNDNAADMRIFVLGVTGMTVDDFIL